MCIKVFLFLKNAKISEIKTHVLPLTATHITQHTKQEKAHTNSKSVTSGIDAFKRNNDSKKKSRDNSSRRFDDQQTNFRKNKSDLKKSYTISNLSNSQSFLSVTGSYFSQFLFDFLFSFCSFHTYIPLSSFFHPFIFYNSCQKFYLL